jgi:glyoxylase I family protein
LIHCEGIHHILVPVTNLQKAKEFYTDVLGLEEAPNFRGSSTVLWYMIGSQQIHLLLNPDAQTLRSGSEINVRDSHFAIRIRDFDEAINHLKALNIPFLEFRDSDIPTGMNHIFFCDPDGNVIELNTERSK